MRLIRAVAPLTIAAAVLAALAPRQSRELTPDEQAVHVLNRLAFGPRPGDVGRIKAVGVDRWIEQQLHPERIDDAVFERFSAQSYTRIRGDRPALLREYAQVQRARQAARRDTTRGDDAAQRERAAWIRGIATELQSAKVARAVASERQLLEVMTDFWANHFNVYIRKNAHMPFLLADYDEGIRERALGDFRELLGFVAKSPAMLVYLDNAQSAADSGQPRLNDRGFLRRAVRRGRGLNENYARELLELHTLGVDGGYTQGDVVEVARALTGWGVRPPLLGGGFVFRAEAHDAGEKRVLGRRLTAGRGIADGEEVLDILAAHPSTARHIAAKLVRRFVSDSPSTQLVERAASAFTRTNGDIRQTLRAIVASPEFFARRAYRSKVKSPFEFVVSTARALGAPADPTPRTALVIGFLGQMPYGHQAPNGYPETGDAWMNTGAILNRINFGLAVGAGRLPGASLSAWPGTARLQSASREQQVRAVAASLIGAPVSAQTERILLTGDHPMIADGSVARAAENAQRDRPMRDDDPDETPNAPRRRAPQGGRAGLFVGAGRIPDLTGLAEVVGLAIGSPEFQRR